MIALTKLTRFKNRPLMRSYIAITTVAFCASQAALAQKAELPEVRVTAIPFIASPLDNTQPVNILRGSELNQSVRSTLGETLSSHTPGVHNSGFGLGAGRPVIRGLDGPRIKTTENGSDTLDVSAISTDHVVAANPLAARAIEIVRGPSTLLYGGSAIGGLVNIVSNLIPLKSLEKTSANYFVDGNKGNHNAAFNIQGGLSGINFSIGAFDKKLVDYKTPLGIQANSFAMANGISLGGSIVGSSGLVGLGVSTNNSRYGAVAEPDVFLSQKQTKLDLLGELYQPLMGIEKISFRRAQNRYQHQEIEAASNSVGTQFNLRGSDSRLEVIHDPLFGIKGVFGLNLLDKQLGVSGAEAYIPNARSKNQALLYVAEKRFGGIRTEFGFRHENAKVIPDPASSFSAQQFNLNTLSGGINVPIALGFSLLSNISKNERAPVAEELFAKGPHIATGTFEIGSASLQKERSTNIDLGVHYAAETVQLKVSAYRNRFTSFIYGQLTDSNGDGVPDRTDSSGIIQNDPSQPGAGDLKRLAYLQARAIYRGIELEAQWRPKASNFSFRGFADLARGTLEGAAQGNAPRMSPTRISALVDYKTAMGNGIFSGYLQAMRVQSVSRLAAQETPTDGYTLMNAEVAYKFSSSSDGPTVYLQGRNLLNQVVRLHTSYIKDIAPMPGRTLVIGVRGQF
jgi:iron complex outermembrane recepter protein